MISCQYMEEVETRIRAGWHVDFDDCCDNCSGQRKRYLRAENERLTSLVRISGSFRCRGDDAIPSAWLCCLTVVHEYPIILLKNLCWQCFQIDLRSDEFIVFSSVFSELIECCKFFLCNRHAGNLLNDDTSLWVEPCQAVLLWNKSIDAFDITCPIINEVSESSWIAIGICRGRMEGDVPMQ